MIGKKQRRKLKSKSVIKKFGVKLKHGQCNKKLCEKAKGE